jgi:gamma-glutamyltranspeptidase/glutathione hydrolase
MWQWCTVKTWFYCLAIGCCLMPFADEPFLSVPAGAAEYDRPGPNRQQSRSEVIAKNGIVATSHPLAAQVGLDILKAGGNAADAAIATNAMMGVVEPMSCGVGGDLFIIYWDAKTKQLYGLNASGRSPYNLNRKIFAEKGLTQIPSTGPLSWSVPGCVDGWEELRAKFGSKPLAQLLAPAIDAAENGSPVAEIIGLGWKESTESLQKTPDAARAYLPGGRAPAIGEMVRLPELAASLRLIANQGRDAFYRGEIAQEIVRFSEANGGYFSLKDFEDHRSDWVQPVRTNYRGYDVWELPPNGQGIAALQMLNVLEGYDLKALGPKHPDYLHLLIEAKKLAFADRSKFYADPAFGKLPVTDLISKKYAEGQRKRIDMLRAVKQVAPGDPRFTQGDTIYLTVVDKDRNCCSLIQSIFHSFGSQIVPGNVGFFLQNRGALFALDDQHLNRFEPHKRPFHTIIPAMVTKDDKPWFCFGVMGGDMQPQGHVQVLVNLIDFGMNVQMSGDSARISHSGSASPTGTPMKADGGTVSVESGIPDAAITELEKRGHVIKRGGIGGFGGYQGILIDWEHGVLRGATESRKDGVAAGY